MSTSFRSRVIATVAAIGEQGQNFIYPPLASDDADQPGMCSPEMLWKIAAPDENEECPRKYTEDDVHAREKQSWEAGLREGENRARAELAQALAAERAAVNAAIESFQHERELYYQRAEAEIVRLALAIARKILHREAQVDPLLLTGVARVALEKIATGSTVRLRVPPTELGRWQETLASTEDLHPQPEVVADTTLNGAQLMLETEVGTADLSLETQLKEIEQGFLDLLALRPERS